MRIKTLLATLIITTTMSVAVTDTVKALTAPKGFYTNAEVCAAYYEESTDETELHCVMPNGQIHRYIVYGDERNTETVRFYIGKVWTPDVTTYEVYECK